MALQEDKRNLRIKNWISFAADSPWRSIFVFMVEGYLMLTVCRFLLVCWQMPRVGGINDSLRILISGIRMDTILLCYLLFLPALLAPLLNGFRATHSVWKFFSCLWFSFCLFFLVLMEVATPFFISEYDTRPNRIFIEYLVYPKEVATMLLKGYKVELFLGGLVAMLILIFARRHYPKLANFPSGWGVPARLFAFPLVLLLIFAGARSSLGHRPANPSTVAFAADQLVNSLTLSSAYSMLYAAYRTIEVTTARDTEQDVKHAQKEIERVSYENYSWLGDAGKRIQQILRGVDHENEMAVMKRWGAYLEAHLNFPFNAEVDEWQERGPLRSGDRVSVKKISLVDDFYGVIVALRLGRRKYDCPLCDLAVIDKQSANAQLIQDYRVWFANR